jgi:hypothetical protein
MQRIKSWLVIPALLVFILWSALYIFRTSFIAIDGQRYFSLFDDGMISMRYAWNLSHGNGLVWNAGGYIEGYSNLLMVLWMSIFTALFDKPTAVLAVQIMGIPMLLGVAYLSKKMAEVVYHAEPWRNLAGQLAFWAALLYYPLIYWTYLGMETGLLALCLLASVFFLVRWFTFQRDMDLYWMSAAAGLAFLTRNDAAIYPVIMFGFLGLGLLRDRQKLPLVLKAGLLFSAFVAGQLLFRGVYYGQILPNTFTLKMSGVPLSVRIYSGLVFMTPFFAQSALVIAAATLGTFVRPDRKKLLLLSLFGAALVYEIWVGGDAWRYWRFTAPIFPAALILAIGSGALLAAWVSRRAAALAGKPLAGYFMAGVAILALLMTDLPFWTEIGSLGQLRQGGVNEHFMNVVIGIEKLTTPDATLGVFSAGLMTYYTGRRSLDFLGKVDPYIANLPPDLSGKIGWYGMKTVPGHNKYDLYYSIRKLQPTYIQDFEWGTQNLKPWVMKNYIRVNYVTPRGDITLILKQGDPSVRWDQARLIPWPEETSP